jgi:hypothetical protein
MVECCAEARARRVPTAIGRQRNKTGTASIAPITILQLAARKTNTNALWHTRRLMTMER